MIDPHALASRLADGYISPEAAEDFTDQIVSEQIEQTRLAEHDDHVTHYARVYSGDVSYLCYEPGDGCRYEIFVSQLPDNVQGGDVLTHSLVTLFGPAGPWAYVLEKDGPLSATYLYEKFSRFRAEPEIPARWKRAAEAIALALGRELIP